MLYVAMTRGGRNNEAYLYQRLSHEADHEHAKPVAAPADQLRRGNKYSAARAFRSILANDDRPRTMHAEAQRTERHLPPVVAEVLQRNEQRRRVRRSVCRHTSERPAAWSCRPCA